MKDAAGNHRYRADEIVLFKFLGEVSDGCVVSVVMNGNDDCSLSAANLFN